MAEIKTGWLKDYNGEKFAPITDARQVYFNGTKDENVQEVLSKKPGRLVAGETFTINETEYIAADGAEIFNDLTNNIAVGLYSHAEGIATITHGSGSHAEGFGSIANGMGSHTEGFGSIANGWGSHAEGTGTIANSNSSHAEGVRTIASGSQAHAEGYNTTYEIYITGNNLSYIQEQQETTFFSNTLRNVILTNEGVISKSNIESEAGVFVVSGGKTYFLNNQPLNEIESSYSIALYSNYTNRKEISGFVTSYSRETSSITIPNDLDIYYLVIIDKELDFLSFALQSYELITDDQKNKYILNPNYKDVSVPYILISESNAHELILKQTLGERNRSRVQIIEINAIGDNSHTEGESTIAYGKNSHVQGKFNIADTEKKYAHILGNGTSTYKRSNAHTVDWGGNAWFSGDVYIKSTSGTNKDSGSKKLATEEYVNSNKSNIVIREW